MHEPGRWMARADAKAGRFFSGFDGSFVPVRAAHASGEEEVNEVGMFTE